MSSQSIRCDAAVKNSAPVVLEVGVDLDADVDGALLGDQVLELLLGAAPVCAAPGNLHTWSVCVCVRERER